MYISMNWIKDFVNLDGIETEELIKKFNLTTAEIEGYEVKGEQTQGVIFAKIQKVENHPISDHLHVLEVNTGSDVLQVVCSYLWLFVPFLCLANLNILLLLT